MNNKTKILHVEDNRVDAMLIEAMLQKIDPDKFYLKNITSLSELEKIENTNEFDIILLDLTLPECQGMETLEKVHALFADIAIVIVSGIDSDGIANDSISYGAQDYLVKGHIVPEVLIRTIRFAIKRKQLESELQESKERFLLAVDGANDGIWDWPDLSKDEHYWSPRLKELLGFESSQISASYETFLSRIHPLDFLSFKDALHSHLKNNIPFDIEFRIKTKDRDYRWFHAKGNAVRDTNGRATRMSGSIRDVNNKKEDEYSLRKLYEVTTDKKLSLDAKAKLILINALSYLNLSLGIVNKITNDKHKILFHVNEIGDYEIDELVATDKQMTAYVLNSDQVISFPDKEGSINYKEFSFLKDYSIETYIGVPIVVNGEVYGALNFYDCNERKATFSDREKTFVKLASQWISGEIEREVFLQTQKSLEEARRLESVGQLAAGVAHEINTPTQFVGDNLRFVKNSIDQMQSVLDYINKLANAEEVDLQHFKDEVTSLSQNVDFDFILSEIPLALGQSIDGVKRIKSIVNAMKSSVHPDGSELQLADINQEIQSACILSRGEWKLVTDMQIDLDDSLPKVPCLPYEINQVVLNMVVNASHSISDEVQSGRYEKGVIKISTKADDKFAEIHIEDNGAGMTDEVKDKLFDPFFTTKGVGIGTGQGLSLAYNVIKEKHKGSIEIESEKGEGAKFVVKLPLQNSMAKQSQPSAG